MADQKPTLNKLDEFKKVLENYHISDHAQSVLDHSQFVVLCGIAGGGRNTLINYLVEHAPYYFVISDTTRPPKFRDGKMEEHGINYNFRDEDSFLDDLRAGEFIEAEIIHNQQVSGTSIRELQKAHEKGLIGIHDYDIGGTENIARSSKKANIIALLPPDFDEWQRRLRGREDMHSEEFKNRMKTAVKILEAFVAEPYYKFVISDNIEHSSQTVRQLVEHGIYSDDQQKTGKKIAESILERTKKLLETL